MNYLNSATSRRKPATEDLYRWTEYEILVDQQATKLHLGSARHSRVL